MVSKDYPVLLFLALAPLLFLCGTLTSGQSFFMRDLTYLFHPWRALSSQMMQGGEMPLWNPYALGGMPFLANCQSSILYPFTLFFTHFHFSLALKLFHFFHYFLASLGFFLLARKLEFSRWIACAGAILFAYNGYLLTRFEFLSVLGGVIWFPWILLCFSVHPFPAVLTLSISFFAGFPQIFILQSGAALFYWLYREQSKENVWKIAKTFFIFLCLIGLHWIPTWELLLNSSRGAGGIPWEEAASYSFPPDGILGLISPFRILHHPDRFTGEKYFWIWSAWWGIAATFFIFCALASKKKKLLTYSLILG
ncbi:MAG: hypothetical protein HYS58_03960, partial [Elusimicrobia bacterium]|nr:hypothetical protein [Elusimicrobiota bacterium]